MSQATKKATTTTVTQSKSGSKVWTSRAVLRLVEAGSWVRCIQCDEPITFRARERREKVICNVYDGGQWQRVEHYHAECYGDAGTPHGAAS